MTLTSPFSSCFTKHLSLFQKVAKKRKRKRFIMTIRKRVNTKYTNWVKLSTSLSRLLNSNISRYIWGITKTNLYHYTTIRNYIHLSIIFREGNGTPLQCSCLENPRDGGAWRAAVYGVAQSWTWLKQLSSSSSSQ